MSIQVYGHRGASAYAPENTLISFQKAIEMKADGVELDIQLSKDGEIVVIHDETIDRTSNGHGYVKDLTLKELKSYNYNRTHPEYEFAAIPTMREVFELIKPTDLIINIELKTGIFFYPSIEEKILALTAEFGMEDRVIYSSFNHYSILRMRKLAPELKCGLLTDCWLINAGKYVHDLDVPCYHPAFRNLTPEITKEIKQYGLEINTWTVNTLEDFKNLESLGVDVAIGNYPELIKG